MKKKNSPLRRVLLVGGESDGQTRLMRTTGIVGIGIARSQDSPRQTYKRDHVVIDGDNLYEVWMHDPDADLDRRPVS